MKPIEILPIISSWSSNILELQIHVAMNRSYCLVEKINGETITGIALIFLAILFLYASSVNQVWAPADFLILVIGGGFLALGIISMKRQKKTVSHV